VKQDIDGVQVPIVNIVVVVAVVVLLSTLWALREVTAPTPTPVAVTSFLGTAVTTVVARMSSGVMTALQMTCVAIVMVVVVAMVVVATGVELLVALLITKMMTAF
jgi:hypothetical protein